MRVLIVTQPGDGHLNPLVPIARALRAAGHEALVATSPSFVSDVERTGLAAVGVGPPWRWDTATELWPDGKTVSGEDSPRFWSQRYNRDITVPFVAGLCELVRKERFDLLFAEWTTVGWAQAVRERAGIPFVAAAWAIEPGYHLFDLDVSGDNEARSRLGLKPIDAFEPSWWVSFTPPRWGALDGPPLPHTRRFRLPAETTGASLPGASGSPFVYATLGTVFNTTRSLLKTFIAAIDSGGWSGLVTVGRTNDPARFDRPPQVAVEQYVPQADALAVADVIVCHGGLGSMLGAMDVGCPMVVVPLGGDQLDNAEKARRLGIARVVEPSNATPEHLRGVIAETLASQSQRSECDRIRREIAAMPDLGDLVRRLEELVTEPVQGGVT